MVDKVMGRCRKCGWEDLGEDGLPELVREYFKGFRDGVGVMVVVLGLVWVIVWVVFRDVLGGS